jgi:hypothetical protein
MSIRNHATEAFGTGTTEGLLTGIPRQKFNFTLSITLSDSGSPIEFTRIQDLTLPGYSFDTQIVNQYNQKRVVQTKLNYNYDWNNFFCWLHINGGHYILLCD